jgi:hypothetical protein
MTARSNSGTGHGDEAFARFAVAYADQTERDHAALLTAAAKGARA